MGKKRWTTDEQRAWLEARVPTFIEAQQTKTAATTFFPETHKAWRELWPTPTPTEADISKWKTEEIARTQLSKKMAEVDFDEVLQKLADFRPQRVVTWFHNNTRVTLSSVGTRATLKLGTSSKLLHGWQAYQHLYYESFKAEVNEEYKSYLEMCKGSEEKPKTAFEFRTEACQKRYAAEMEAVKAEVEEYRAKLRDGEDTNLEKDTDARNKEIQSAIEKLPRTLNKIGRAIADQTKWQVTIMLGGPTPRLNGKLMTLICHFGTTTDGRTFEEYLGQEGYQQHIETTFDNFLHASFSTEECNDHSLNLSSKESTPQGDEIKTNEIGKRENEADKGKAKGKEREYNTAGPISQYEVERKRNIAKNKEALKKVDEEFREKYGEVFEQDKLPTKTSRKKKEKANLEGQRRVSARLNVAGQSDSAGSPTAPTTDSHTDGGEPHGTNVEAHSGSNGHVNTNTDDAIATEGKITTSTNFEAHSRSTGHVNSNADDAIATVGKIKTSTSGDTSSPAVHDQGQVDGGFKHIFGEEDQDGGMEIDDVSSNGESGMEKDVKNHIDSRLGLADEGLDNFMHDIERMTSPSPVSRSPSAAVIARVSSPRALIPSTAMVPPSGAFTPIAPRSPTTSPTSATSHAVPSSPKPKTIPCLPTSNGLAPTLYASKLENLVLNDVPPWLKSILEYLRNVSSDDIWQELVFRFVTFESRHPPAGKLPTKERPEEVSAWIRRHRKDVVPEFKVSEFGIQWMRWWREIQPDWRKEEEDTLSRQIPEDETWGSLTKGGTAGLYTVVMSLSWWIKQVASDGSFADVWMSVKDVSWVLHEVTESLPLPGGTKRLGEDGDTECNNTPVKMRILANSLIKPSIVEIQSC